MICGAPAENAHTRTGGTSRKGHYTTIIPLCTRHHDESHHGIRTFAAKYRLDLEVIAAAVESAWLAHSAP